MVKALMIGLGVCLVATLAFAQAGAPPAGAPPGRGGGAGASLPTQAQWDAMPARGREYVEAAKELAGNDPDLQFDFGVF